jgi:predicted transcriptional regulator
MRQVRQLNIEKKEDEEEIRKLIERLNDEQVKSEYNMKRLEELSAREMDQIKSESDRYMLSLNSLLKINDKILEICFSNNDLRVDLYDKHRQLIAKGKGRK